MSPRVAAIAPLLLLGAGCEWIAGIQDVVLVNPNPDQLTCPAPADCTVAPCPTVTLGDAVDGGAVGVTVDDAFVWFTAPAAGEVLIFSPHLTSPLPFAQSPAARRITVDGDGVFWTHSGDACVSRVPRTGTVPADVGTCAQGAFTAGDGRVTTDAERVYWMVSDGATRRVLAAEKQAGAPSVVVATDTSIAAVLEHASGLVVEANHVYWGSVADDGVSGVVRRAPLSAVGSSDVLATFQGTPVGLGHLRGDPYLYVVAHDGLGVYRQPLAGGDWVLLAPAHDKIFAGPTDMALDDRFVYWVDHAFGRILRAPQAPPSEAETLFQGDALDPQGIAADCSFVYWTTQRGALMRRTR